MVATGVTNFLAENWDIIGPQVAEIAEGFRLNYDHTSGLEIGERIEDFRRFSELGLGDLAEWQYAMAALDELYKRGLRESASQLWELINNPPAPDSAAFFYSEGMPHPFWEQYQQLYTGALREQQEQQHAAYRTARLEQRLMPELLELFERDIAARWQIEGDVLARALGLEQGLYRWENGPSSETTYPYQRPEDNPLFFAPPAQAGQDATAPNAETPARDSLRRREVLRHREHPADVGPDESIPDKDQVMLEVNTEIEAAVEHLNVAVEGGVGRIEAAAAKIDGIAAAAVAAVAHAREKAIAAIKATHPAAPPTGTADRPAFQEPSRRGNNR